MACFGVESHLARIACIQSPIDYIRMLENFVMNTYSKFHCICLKGYRKNRYRIVIS